MKPVPKIDRGIPIPPRFGKWKALFLKMKKGDSVLLSSDAERCIAMRGARTAGAKAISRKIDGQGIRVWKTR